MNISYMFHRYHISIQTTKPLTGCRTEYDDQYVKVTGL